jgi:hypothetical protein
MQDDVALWLHNADMKVYHCLGLLSPYEQPNILTATHVEHRKLLRRMTNDCEFHIVRGGILQDQGQDGLVDEYIPLHPNWQLLRRCSPSKMVVNWSGQSKCQLANLLSERKR